MSALAPVLAAASDPAVRDVTVLAGVLLAYALVSRKLHGSPITPAIVFVVAGLVLGNEGLNAINSEVGARFVRLIAEVTLAFVLFTDAASLRAGRLRKEGGLPARLLLVGLPLTIVAGTLVGLPLFGDLTLFEVVIIAIVLAPTDAALGETVVADERIPSELRQGLNVESGLNDGICVPLLFAAIAFAELEEAPRFEGEVLVDLMTEVVVAAAVGIAVAAVAAVLLRAALRSRWVSTRWLQVVPLATAAIAYTLTVQAGGSGFVATFAGGLVYRVVLGRHESEESLRLTEELGGLASAVTFFVFGAVVVGETVTDLDVPTVVYAVLSLTLIRMVPVAVALGRGPKLPTVAFAGWFGPRGLASIVFALIIVEDADLPGTAAIVQVACLTVLLSVFAHGLSAPFLTNRYTAWAQRREAELASAARPVRESGRPASGGG